MPISVYLPQAVLLDSLVVTETRTEPIEARVQMGTVAVAVEQIEAAPTLLGADRVFFSIYRGADRYGIDTSYEPEDPASGAPLATESMGRIGWGNLTSALRWNHLFSNKLFSNTTLTYSRYRFGAQVEQTERFPGGDRTEGIDYFSGIHDLSGRIDFDYMPSPRHYVRFDAHATHHTFTPSTLQFVAPAGESLPDSVGGVRRVRGVELSAYAEDELQVTDRLAVNVGLHASAFRVEDQLYPSLQPRISARYLLPGAVALKGSFAGTCGSPPCPGTTTSSAAPSGPSSRTTSSRRSNRCGSTAT